MRKSRLSGVKAVVGMDVARPGARVVAGALVAVLTGCSLDTVIWGTAGARVIETTDELIHAAASREQSALACVDTAADFGDPQDWEGLSAGEPEQFHAAYWKEQASLDPAWNINLELGVEVGASGHVFPNDVFYRETDEGLCVIDIAWSTVER
jgi:hypothetical protein